MPARIPSPGVAEFVMSIQCNGELCINRYHYFSGVPWTAGFLNGMAEFLWAWWVTNVMPLVHAEVILLRVDAVDLSTPTSAAISYVGPPPNTGTQATAAMPNNVTIALKWTTETRGRSARGRTFHIGLGEPQCSGNEITAITREQLLDAYRLLIDDPGILELTVFSVLSEVTAGAPRAAGVAFPITGIACDPTIDTQRRRLP